jgi:hypothetical protein
MDYAQSWRAVNLALQESASWSDVLFASPLGVSLCARTVLAAPGRLEGRSRIGNLARAATRARHRRHIAAGGGATVTVRWRTCAAICVSRTWSTTGRCTAARDRHRTSAARRAALPCCAKHLEPSAGLPRRPLHPKHFALVTNCCNVVTVSNPTVLAPALPLSAGSRRCRFSSGGTRNHCPSAAPVATTPRAGRPFARLARRSA